MTRPQADPTRDPQGHVTRWLSARRRLLLAGAAIVLTLGAALPPAAGYARQYASLQALQFVVFAVAAPALLVLARAGPTGQADQGLSARPVTRVAVIRLLPFIGTAIVWRLPVVLRALAEYPLLTAAELVTLTGAGTWLWLALAGTPERRPALPRPLRAVMAAAAAWAIWVIAYITGMSHGRMPAHARGVANLVTAADDRQVAVAIMWLVPAVCFAPFVYATLMAWLGERERAEAITMNEPPEPARQPGLQPPRGWRSRS